MIGKQEGIQSKDFSVGLYTRSDIINPNPNLSPNCMDIQWFFDSSIGKRLGSSTTNTVAITSGGPVAGWVINVGGNLNTNLTHYWNMNELTGTRADSVGVSSLATTVTSPLAQIGIVNSAAFMTSSVAVYVNSDDSMILFNSSMTLSCWYYYVNTNGSETSAIIAKGMDGGANPSREYMLRHDAGSERFEFSVMITGNVAKTVTANSFGAPSQNTWYNVVGWKSANSHIGISVNLSVDTLLTVANANTNNTNWPLSIGSIVNTDGITVATTDSPNAGARIDEVAMWKRFLTVAERGDLYNSGVANYYSSAGTINKNSWASFDFGASSVRWLTIAAGTGIFASSNLGVNFLTIASSRTANYQYLDRSRNVLIATSEAQDLPLYWAGSAGTFASILAINSAPSCKYNINYQGFLILLNSSTDKRLFAYADENLQLTDAWNNSFTLPSSADDEITAPFILNKFLYVSTKYRMFRLNYTGGNPDWSYIEVANFGYVPRTVQVFSVSGGKMSGQVAVGLDWNNHLRAFYGYDSEIISDNIESNNNYCEFAMSKISRAGSGIIVSHAEFDINTQEYRLNLAIGTGTTRTTHAIVFNARSLAMYPYSYQNFGTMCMAESGNQSYLMAADISGYVHILNSGNLDGGVTAINEVYDSPLLFNNSPSAVTKNRQINFFFSPTSSGTLYHQERFDFSNVFSGMKPLRNYQGQSELLSTESTLQLVRTIDLPSVQNIYQYRLTSSAGTANPWRLTHFDLFNSALGVGRGG